MGKKKYIKKGRNCVDLYFFIMLLLINKERASCALTENSAFLSLPIPVKENRKCLIYKRPA